MTGVKALSRTQRWRSGVDPDALYQHHSAPRRAEVSRRSNHGKAYSRIVRWNAMAMVQRANKRLPGLGGHISSYASSASLMKLASTFLSRTTGPWWWRPDYDPRSRSTWDLCPCVRGRSPRRNSIPFDARQAGETLLLPTPLVDADFWQFPTVSMGLGPISAIYQARFNRYLHNRGIKDTSENRVWAYLGDGECDEPETLTALSRCAEGLDNLTFVVNRNLQRPDGLVRGNGKVIQELEAVFREPGGTSSR